LIISACAEQFGAKPGRLKAGGQAQVYGKVGQNDADYLEFGIKTL
jgi:hypothetical protein